MQEKNATTLLTESPDSVTMLAVEPSKLLGLFDRKSSFEPRQDRNPR
jgi:hypothetical protein